jgi:hypothetical protein
MMQNDDAVQAGFYRCQVSQEQSQAWLRVEGRRLAVELRESAIDGFTITVAGKHAHKLRLGRTWVLGTRRETNRVHAEWVFHSPGGDVQVGLRRMEEILQNNEPRGGVLAHLNWQPLVNHANSAELGLAGLLLSLFALLSMPGIGDALGTAPIIYEVATKVIHALGGWVR